VDHDVRGGQKKKRKRNSGPKAGARVFVADTGLQARGEGGAACAAPW